MQNILYNNKMIFHQQMLCNILDTLKILTQHGKNVFFFPSTEAILSKKIRHFIVNNFNVKSINVRYSGSIANISNVKTILNFRWEYF